MNNIELDHDINCKQVDGKWSCSKDHSVRKEIHWFKQRIIKLEGALKERSELCSDAVCRAKCREALKV